MKSRKELLNSIGQAVMRFFRAYFTWPGWKDCMPRGWLQWTSAILLLVLFCGYASFWTYNNRVMFTDRMLQDDDVRIHVMPMHRYDGKGTLKDDPVALDMLASSTLGFRLLHMASVPMAGLTGAPKVTIVFCYVLFLISMIITARSKHAGLASAILLGFLFLHTDKITKAVTAGVERAFAFPVIAIWMAGVLSRSKRVRYSAIILGAITYPAVMVLVLAAEGILILQDGIQIKSKEFRRQIRTYAIVVVACFALIQIDSLTKPDAGRLPTFEQAAANPAFGPLGRTTRIPLVDPEDEIRSTLSKFFAEGAGNEFWSGHEGYLGLETAGPMLIFSLLILLCIFRISPRPCPAVALFCGCLILYFLARAYAFRLLYIPHRYLSYGISATGLMLIVYALGLVGDRISDVRMRAAVRNIVVAAAIGIGVFLTGDHLKAKASIIIDGHVHEPLWEYMSNLPRDIKVAAHPIDASGISFWTGRAATPGVEQLLPWFDEAWKRNKAKAEDSLRLVYAMSADDVFTICEKEGITHILLNTKRYADNFGEKSMTFEPLTGFTLELLKDVDLADLVFSNPPAEASLVKHREYNLIDVSLLRKAWAEPGE